MTIKVLLDPILTSSPQKCSTNTQFDTFVRRMLASRNDVFFYWIVPEYVEEADFASYPQHPNIKYLRSNQSKDRVREYITMAPALEDWLAFNGTQWDFDILLTVRSGLVPLMRLIMTSPREKRWFWTKEVWLIEEMPMVSFKDTVPQMMPNGVHDRFTIEGYIAAEKVFLCSYHEKPGIMREARQWYAPSVVRALEPKLQPMVTAQFEDYLLKPADSFFRKDGEQQFGLAYIGRMEKANNTDDVYEIMEKAWVLRGDRVKPIACTVSTIVKSFDEEIVDVRFPPREEFWEIVKTELHAFIYMPKGGGFSLSLIEPLMLGTPVITVRNEVHESLLGPDYPFYAPGPSGVYAMFKALYDDYEGQYARFAKWQKEWFEPTYRRRFSEDLLYPKLEQGLIDYEAMVEARKEEISSLRDNETVKLLAKEMASGEETMFECVNRLGKAGLMDVLADKTRDNDRLRRSITFSQPWNALRLGLKLFHNYEDASVRTGHLRLRG